VIKTLFIHGVKTMKPRFALVFSLILSLIFGQILSLIFVNSVQADSKKNVYSCIDHEGKPMTVVDTTRGRIQLIVWESDYFRASGWTPEKRCQEVSKRFQQFSDNNRLRFIANGMIGKYQVICVSPQSPPPSTNIVCQEQNLLMTLEPKDKPVEVMKQLFEDAVKIGAMPIRRGQAVLDLDKYFAVAPLMDAISPIQKPPLIPEEKKPPQSGTTIECPPILCD